jgi:hypothetical protein
MTAMIPKIMILVQAELASSNLMTMLGTMMVGMATTLEVSKSKACQYSSAEINL